MKYYFSQTASRKGFSHVLANGRWIRFTEQSNDPKFKSCHPDCTLVHTGTGKEKVQAAKK